jgi:hypothetical protein
VFGFWEGWAAIAVARVLAASAIFAVSRGFVPISRSGGKVDFTSLTLFARCISAVQASIRDSPWQASSMLRLTYIPSAFTDYGLALLPAALMPASAFFIPMIILEPLTAFVPACIGASASTAAVDFHIPMWLLVLTSVALVAAALILAHISSGVVEILSYEAGQRQSEVGLAGAARRGDAARHGEDQDYPYLPYSAI